MDVLQNIKRKARKAHCCNYCYGAILPGETYSYAALKEGGELYEWKNHEKCGTVASELWDYIDPCEGMTAEDFQEGCREFCTAFMIDQNEGYPDWFNDPVKCAEKVYEHPQTHDLKKVKDKHDWMDRWICEPKEGE